MHVVILAEFASPSGGAEKVAVESARGLAEAGLRVTYVQGVAGPVDPLLDHRNLTRICLDLPDVWARNPVAAAVAGIWHARAARALSDAIGGMARAPDVVHVHQWTRSLSPGIFPVLLATGAPVALTLHDYFLACPNGVYYRFDTAEPCALAPMSAACILAPCDARSRLHKLVRVARTAAARRAVSGRGLHVVHVCDASRARMGAMLGGYGLTHHRIDNPVRVAPGAPAAPERGDAVAYVGRLTREKGADLVAAAAREAGLTALLVGTGPLEAELRAMPHVEMLGWQAPEAVQAVLRRRARALAAPSRWFETGPLTVYEALAAGIPVVASDRSGAAEKVLDGTSGFVVPPELAALSAAFVRLADDARVAAMGRAAHGRFWAAPMTIARHAEASAALYAGLLRTRRDAMQHA
ncbi:glycosyltransferase family 4 protein [Methylobacterium sp. E-016]|uniref:glycosyltransferase family 4 protein n=1 Tax=Methylobacterium sp. E-016 TaxID=2836556 RepID=UPI001FBB137F|nr:glycosyltransferase family 4 protein [Methylobacterium sp. E-016]MCJ2075878.1 glycosyltransferase family 4 protein [Methylobacterium sp. E-016]